MNISFKNNVLVHYSTIKIDTDEIWKVINDFPNYLISNYGRVKRINSRYDKFIDKYLPISLNGFGYYTISLHKGHKTFRKAIHKLVAEHFVPNPNNYPIINHKDENKFNNKFDNLEWCNIGYNVLYSNNNIKAANQRKTAIKFIDNKGNEYIYDSIVDCARNHNLDASSISKRITNTANCYSKYKFIML